MHAVWRTDQEFVEMMHLKPMAQWVLFATATIAVALLGSCGGRDGSDTVLQIVTVTSPATPGSMAPHLAVTPSGEAVMSWLEPLSGEGHALRYATLQHNNWSAPLSIAKDKRWFVNWADVPSVVPITAQHWAAHWLVKRPGGTYSYDIALSVSADGGASWPASLTPHTDNTPTEHGFVTIFTWSDGIGGVWLDGRNMVPDTGGQSSPDDSKKYGGMTLRFARLGYDGEVLDDGEIDNFVCDCCQTDVAVTAAGPVVVYRDRTTGETRDISVTRYVDGGWAKPITVSDDRWQISGCPVNGPAIAADGERVVVAWYAAPNRDSRIKLAWSQDAAQTFSAPVVVDEAGVKGHVDVALLPNSSAMVSWTGKTEAGIGQVRMRQVTMGGDRGPVQVIAEGQYSRNSGFPQMVRAGDRLVFAWPGSGESKQVLTAFSPLGGG
ncbi:MAG: hypothetical protein CL798_04985 [Chromatiales bacterium]|nr:hypothetical protein [Chromatiales bacterium]